MFANSHTFSNIDLEQSFRVISLFLSKLLAQNKHFNDFVLFIRIFESFILNLWFIVKDFNYRSMKLLNDLYFINSLVNLWKLLKDDDHQVWPMDHGSLIWF